MTDEEEVKIAQMQARQTTFRTMLPILTNIRAEARKYVQEYVDSKHVPYYNVLSYQAYDYITEPQLEYDFQFVISGNLHFDIVTFIRINKEEDVVYMVNVSMRFNKDEDLHLDGSIMIHTGDIDNYVNSIKDACDLCFKKYLELHEHFKDKFF